VRTSSDRRTTKDRRRAALGWLGGVVVVVGIGLAGFDLAGDWADPGVPTQGATQGATSPVVPEPTRVSRPAPQVAKGSVAEIPRSLSVPALGIDSLVRPVSAEDGVLVPPADPRQLGWWQDGARVGASAGSILITGHTVHTGGGAMDHLSDLVVDDLIVVGTDRGDVDFTVTAVRYYPKQSLADQASSTFDQSGPNRLVLITCERWNGTSYDGNTVVIAEPVPSTLELGEIARSGQGS